MADKWFMVGWLGERRDQREGPRIDTDGERLGEGVVDAFRTRTHTRARESLDLEVAWFR